MPEVTIDRRAIDRPDSVEYRLEYWRVLMAVADQAPIEDEDPRSTPSPISPTRLRLAGAGIDHLSQIVKQLVELWTGPMNDDYGRLQPTQYAFDTTVELLVDAAIDGQFDEQRKIPYGCVSTDSEGGVRIEWIRERVSVHLIVPPDRSKVAYVYHEFGGNYATEDATPERLSYWLRTVS